MGQIAVVEEVLYGFTGRLTEYFPSQILVDVAESCNLECVHCPHVDFKRSEHYAGRKLDVELNRKLVDEVRTHGKGLTEYIRYASNGEPLIHPRIFEMLTYAAQNSGTKVTLTTNGVLLDPVRIQKLIDSGTDVVDISIDAFSNETYAKVRVKGDLDVTRTNVLNLIAAVKEQGSSLKVVVSYVELPQNMHETDRFEEFWKSHGADYVVVRRQHSCSGVKEELAEVRRNENASVERRPCLYPWERIVLNAQGHLDFCPSDWVHGSVIADYRTTTVLETWNGEFYKNLRNAHLANDYSCHGFCGQCPDWISTRWPHEGRSYANMIEEFKDTE